MDERGGTAAGEASRCEWERGGESGMETNGSRPLLDLRRGVVEGDLGEISPVPRE